MKTIFYNYLVSDGNLPNVYLIFIYIIKQCWVIVNCLAMDLVYFYFNKLYHSVNDLWNQLKTIYLTNYLATPFY